MFADCLRMKRLSHDILCYLGRKLAIPRRNEAAVADGCRHMYTNDLVRILGDILTDDIEYFCFDSEGPTTREIVVRKTCSHGAKVCLGTETCERRPE